MKKLISWYNEKEDKIRLVFTGLSGACLLAYLILSWCNVSGIGNVILPCIAIVLCGLPIIAGAIIGVVKEHDITADVLVSLALIGSLILQEWFAAGEVAFIMQIGSILEDFTSNRAKKGISKLIKLTPKKANLLKNDEYVVVEADEIKIDDIIQVKAGESIPIDGVIIEGNTSVDQSAMTGESIPVEKKMGDQVMSGTINQNGVIIIRAIKTAENSSLQRMVKLANSADAQKAKIVRKANKWAAYLVIVSLSTALIAGLVIGFMNQDFWLGFTRAVTVLVVFCPCAFVLATPTAISAGIGNSSRHGIIIQSGEALERISEANIAVFDKTGTLTKGMPSVTKVEVKENITEEELVRIAASGEINSTHPLANAIVKYNKLDLYKVKNHQTISGKGIEFELDKDKYFVGKTKLKSIDGESTVGVYKNDVLLGIIYIEDTLKDNAKEMVEELKALNIKTVLLTGDNEISAHHVGDLLDIDEVISNCTPEGKMEYIKKQEESGSKVAMFGDGVNDSLALRKAYAGIAMGGIGSDVAIESADAVIVNDNVDVIPYLFRISRKTKTRITINLSLSMIINLIAVVLSIMGTLNTVWGALYHNCGSVAIVISAFLLLFSKDKNDKKTAKINLEKTK